MVTISVRNFAQLTRKSAIPSAQVNCFAGSLISDINTLIWFSVKIPFFSFELLFSVQNLTSSCRIG